MFSSSYLRSAERIQFWLGRDRALLFPIPVSTQLIKNHQCNWIENIHGTSQTELVFFYGGQGARHKKSSRTQIKDPTYLHLFDTHLDSQVHHSALQAQCCINQKKPYFLDNFLKSTSITADRIFHWQLHKHCILSYQIKNILKGEILGCKHRDIIAVDLTKSHQLDESPSEWKDLIRAQDDQCVTKLPLY